MDDPGVVGGGQRRGDGFQVVEGQQRIQGGVAGDEPAQRLTVDELHHDVRLASGDALVEDADDCRVVDQGSGTRLPVELRRELVILAKVSPHDFDRYGSLESRITGSVDRRHTAPGDFCEDLVAVVQHTSDHRVVGTAFVHHGLLGKLGDLSWAISSASIEFRPIVK